MTLAYQELAQGRGADAVHSGGRVAWQPGRVVGQICLRCGRRLVYFEHGAPKELAAVQACERIVKPSAPTEGFTVVVGRTSKSF